MRLNGFSCRGQDSDLVLAKGGVHNPVEVHDGGIEAPHCWADETPVGLVNRFQNWIAYAEGMARCLPERRDDKAVRPPDDKRRLVRRVRSKAAFDPSWLHQDRQAAPVNGPELLRQDEEGVTHHLFLLVQQPEVVTIEVRLS